MSQTIHPSAVIHKTVELGPGVVVGPNCVIDEGTVIGEDTVIDANVVIGKNVRIGKRNQLFANCAVGRAPQLLGMAPDAEYGLLEIGDDNTIREQVTIHPSMHADESTIIGNNNLLMVGVHIGHDSVLADIDWSNVPEEVISFIVTMTGHDGTYGDTIYARHAYYPDDIRPGHRFVDVVGEMPDGRFIIDYSKFHDTIDPSDG